MMADSSMREVEACVDELSRDILGVSEEDMVIFRAVSDQKE